MPFVFLAVAGAIAFQGWRWWQAGEWWKTVLLGLGIAAALGVGGWALARWNRKRYAVHDTRLVKEKASRSAFEAELELTAILSAHGSEERARELLDGVASAYAHYDNVAGARFSPVGVSAFALCGGMMITAALLLLVVMLAEGGTIFLPTDAASSGLWGLLWATAGQAITYSCFFEIVRRAGALFFAQLNYVVVAAGIFWASIFFGAALSHWVWAAVAVLVLSLVLINAGTARGLREQTARYEAERSDQ
jgi:hypothetical protein